MRFISALVILIGLFFSIIIITIALVEKVDPSCRTVEVIYNQCKTNCKVIFTDGNTGVVTNGANTGDRVCRDNVNTYYINSKE